MWQPSGRSLLPVHQAASCLGVQGRLSCRRVGAWAGRAPGVQHRVPTAARVGPRGHQGERRVRRRHGRTTDLPRRTTSGRAAHACRPHKCHGQTTRTTGAPPSRLTSRPTRCRGWTRPAPPWPRTRGGCCRRTCRRARRGPSPLPRAASSWGTRRPRSAAYPWQGARARRRPATTLSLGPPHTPTTHSSTGTAGTTGGTGSSTPQHRALWGRRRSVQALRPRPRADVDSTQVMCARGAVAGHRGPATMCPGGQDRTCLGSLLAWARGHLKLAFLAPQHSNRDMHLSFALRLVHTRGECLGVCTLGHEHV